MSSTTRPTVAKERDGASDPVAARAREAEDEATAVQSRAEITPLEHCSSAADVAQLQAQIDALMGTRRAWEGGVQVGDASEIGGPLGLSP